MEKCPFCAIRDRTSSAFIIWEDRDFLAFLDIQPIRPGHTLLIPKNHVDYIFDMEEAMFRGFFEAAKGLSEPLRRAMKSQRIGIAVEGFRIPHAHIHLVPINGTGDIDPCRAKKADPDELARIHGIIVQEVRKHVPSTIAGKRGVGR